MYDKRMFKWIFLALLIIFLGIFIYLLTIYQSIEKNRTAGFEDIEAIVLKDTDISTVEEIYRFHEKESYAIVEGVTDKNERLFVFMLEEEKDRPLKTVKGSDIIDKQTILNEWEANCDQCTLVDITPAMIDDDPLWEITYRDHRDRYIFDYVSVYDGSAYEQLQFKQMFN